MAPVIDVTSRETLKDALAACVEADRHVLEELRSEIRPLRTQERRIQPRSTTSVSLVGTDGGNNQLQFDPFLIQIIRVVDSSNNEYCLEAVSPTTPVTELDTRHLTTSGDPLTPLGSMMRFLGVRHVADLSPAIHPPRNNEPVSPSWVGVYRELVEWATLFALLEKDFGTDTLIVFDGLLRSKMFAGDLFMRLIRGVEDRIARHRQHNRHLYLAGVAKHSKVLDRYRLAMALEGILQGRYPAYVLVPREVEEHAYVWGEYARGNDVTRPGTEVNKFVGGKMYLAKFGGMPRDPIWPVDLLLAQQQDASRIFGAMLSDAVNGFPVPNYPLCLQKAHENAALVDFDFDILQDAIYDAVRATLGPQTGVLDAFRLQDPDPSRSRYS